jgi:putative transposase
MLRNDNDILEQQACYYMTFNVVDWIDIFVRPVFKQIIVESLNYFIEKKGLTVYSWCLMTNHLHLMARAKQGYGLSLIASDFQKFTTRIILEDIDAESEPRRKWMMKRFEQASESLKFLAKYQVWQTSINPVFIDLENMSLVNDQLDHIHGNPVRDRIVSLPEDYLYSSARDYAGVKGLVNVRALDKPGPTDFILRHISPYRHYHQD